MSSVEEIKKIMAKGFKDSEKDKEKIVRVRSFYEETFDWQTNYARLIYDVQFDYLCRVAEKEKRDLWEYLSNEFMFSDVRYLIEPPDKLKNKKGERELWIKNQYRPWFFEFYVNHRSRPIEHAFQEGLLGFRVGGTKRGKQQTQKSLAHRKPIIEERKKLIDSGIKNEKEIMKHVRKKLSKRKYDEIQKTILAEKKKEADERRLQKPHALSP